MRHNFGLGQFTLNKTTKLSMKSENGSKPGYTG